MIRLQYQLSAEVTVGPVRDDSARGIRLADCGTQSLSWLMGVEE